MEERQRILDLIARYQADSCTDAERQLVDRVLFSLDENVPLSAEALHQQEAIWIALQNAIRQEQPVPVIRRFRRWIPYAAAVILTLAFGYFLWNSSHHQKAERFAFEDVAPGGNLATLTLEDGRTIELSNTQSGIVIGNGITYLDGTRLITDEALVTDDEKVYFQTVKTPKGGTYQITLPDGSVVWLNAASTLRYPSRFNHEERLVELEGEAYFDIKPQKKDQWKDVDAISENLGGNKPFKVLTAGQAVEVLGTQFNISAYAGEPETKTTLVEGSVRLSLTQETLDGISSVPAVAVYLKPGQQATTLGSAIEVNEVDIESYTAWHDGYFKFHQQPITEIMRQLVRWYDVDVRYEGPIGSSLYSGRISRTENISAVLRTMELTDEVHFEIDGNERRIIVKH